MVKRVGAFVVLLGVAACGGGSTAPTPTTPTTSSSQIQPPVKLVDVRPVYPPEAQAARVQGVVILEAVIGTDGHIQNVTALRSIPLLDQAAIDAVRQWVYSPELVNGQPVAITITVTVNFTLA
jgi:protein TonB